MTPPPKKGLGKQGMGLDLIIPPKGAGNINIMGSKLSEKDRVLHIDINKIEPDKEQPRTTFNDEPLEELAQSIKSVGIISPIIVSKSGEFYKIISGERRWRAARIAGLKEVPVIVMDIDDMKRLEVALIENIQREDLNPVEEALTYKRFQDDFKLTQEQIAEKVGKARTTVANSMRLLKLDEGVLVFLRKNLLTTGHARALISIDDKKLQFEFAEKIIDEQLSVRQTEEIVRELLEENDETTNNKKDTQDPESEQKALHYTKLSDNLKNILGTKVKIKNNKNNKGKIEIEYYSPEELDRLICLFNKLN